MAHLHGKTGNIYNGEVTIDATTSTWNNLDPVAGVTVSIATGVDGTAARATTVGVGASINLMARTIGSLEISTYEGIVFRIRSSLDTSAGDLQLLLSENGILGNPSESLDIPALTANTWQLVYLSFAGDPVNRNTVRSIGLRQIVDLADGTFDVEFPKALQRVGGLNNFSITYTSEMVNTTDFMDVGASSFISGPSNWGVSFSGLKDGVPLIFGSEAWLVLEEGPTAGQNWVGRAIINGITPTTDINDAINYDYTAQGTKALGVPTA